MLLVAMASVTGAAQTVGVRGTVLSPARQGLSGVVVTLERDGEAAKIRISDAEGEFLFEGVARGTYRLVAFLSGYEDFVTDLLVESEEVSFEIALNLTRFSETVMIEDTFATDGQQSTGSGRARDRNDQCLAASDGPLPGSFSPRSGGGQGLRGSFELQWVETESIDSSRQRCQRHGSSDGRVRRGASPAGDRGRGGKQHPLLGGVRPSLGGCGPRRDSRGHRRVGRRLRRSAPEAQFSGRKDQGNQGGGATGQGERSHQERQAVVLSEPCVPIRSLEGLRCGRGRR